MFWREAHPSVLLPLLPYNTEEEDKAPFLLELVRGDAETLWKAGWHCVGNNPFLGDRAVIKGKWIAGRFVVQRIKLDTKSATSHYHGTVLKEYSLQLALCID